MIVSVSKNGSDYASSESNNGDQAETKVTCFPQRRGHFSSGTIESVINLRQKGVFLSPSFDHGWLKVGVTADVINGSSGDFPFWERGTEEKGKYAAKRLKDKPLHDATFGCKMQSRFYINGRWFMDVKFVFVWQSFSHLSLVFDSPPPSFQNPLPATFSRSISPPSTKLREPGAWCSISIVFPNR